MHFLKAKDINKQFRVGSRGNKFQSSVQTQAKFVISSKSPVLSRISYEIQNLFSTFGVVTEINYFEKIFKTVAQTLALIQCM